MKISENTGKYDKIRLWTLQIVFCWTLFIEHDNMIIFPFLKAFFFGDPFRPTSNAEHEDAIRKAEWAFKDVVELIQLNLKVDALHPSNAVNPLDALYPSNALHPLFYSRYSTYLHTQKFEVKSGPKMTNGIWYLRKRLLITKK